jgi:hypothetical protein
MTGRHSAGGHAGAAAKESEHDCLRQELRADLRPGRAERAAQLDLGAAFEHALLEETLGDRGASLTSTRTTLKRLLALSEEQGSLLEPFQRLGDRTAKDDGHTGSASRSSVPSPTHTTPR